ncbi:MAG: carboxypeptidase regulatory-like domain-containing protein [Deltaproteobacteria bacterium]|nr:carboxypeptidase regulatory-like domain-containing protein [Deltaproteobacteria bacterium]
MVERRVLPLLLLAGCWGRGFAYEGGVPQDTSAPAASECGNDLDLEAGINVAGTATDLQTGQPVVRADTALPALCVAAIDPSPAVVNGDPEDLVTSTLCDDGTYVLAGIEEIPSIGLMVGIYDCAATDDEATVMRTVTGVASDDFEGFGPGDTLEGVTAWSISSAFLAEMQADLESSTPDLRTEGFLSGFVTDANGAPVDGATVTCGNCDTTPTYYLDAAPEDGLFGDGTTFNASTEADARAFFLIPAANITTYEADDGGAHTWDGALFGSLAGYGVFIQFDGQ